MTKRCGGEKPKTGRVGKPPVTKITDEEPSKLNNLMKKRLATRRTKYPEVRGKIVDYITHSVDNTTLYFTVWFKDKSAFSLRYGCELFIVGADYSDWKTGDDHILRQYMKPIPRWRHG